MIPYEIWVNVLSFICNLKDVRNFSQVCMMFDEVTKINLVWKMVTKHRFPIVYENIIKSAM
jgi:hypothetical protein